MFFGLCIQSLILTVYLVIFEKKQFKKLSQNKFQCLSAGLCGFFATLSWFYAFTLIQGSMVRAIGQIELLFSYFSYYNFLFCRFFITASFKFWSTRILRIDYDKNAQQRGTAPCRNHR